MWQLKSAENGNAQAQYNMHVNTMSGSAGFEKDEIEARRWLRRSAKQGFAASQGTLATQDMISAQTSDNPTQHAAAFKWARRAAHKGDTQGQQLLGLAYWDGKGVKQNVTLAAQWLQRSVRQNDKHSAFSKDALKTILECNNPRARLEAAAAIEPKAMKHADEELRRETREWDAKREVRDRQRIEEREARHFARDKVAAAAAAAEQDEEQRGAADSFLTELGGGSSGSESEIEVHSDYDSDFTEEQIAGRRKMVREAKLAFTRAMAAKERVDAAEAVKNFRKAATLGHAEAQVIAP
jgi:TPR repeat protein